MSASSAQESVAQHTQSGGPAIPPLGRPATCHPPCSPPSLLPKARQCESCAGTAESPRLRLPWVLGAGSIGAIRPLESVGLGGQDFVGGRQAQTPFGRGQAAEDCLNFVLRPSHNCRAVVTRTIRRRLRLWPDDARSGAPFRLRPPSTPKRPRCRASAPRDASTRFPSSPPGLPPLPVGIGPAGRLRNRLRALLCGHSPTKRRAQARTAA